jgi:hypothetical protein
MDAGTGSDCVKRRGLPVLRILIVSIGVAALIAVHGVVLHYVLPYTAVSAAVALGVIALVVIKHLRLLGPLYTLLRRRRRP